MASHTMTEQQSKLLAFIVSAQWQRGFTPSYAEMATHMGLASKGGIARLVDALRASGHIQAPKGRARSIRVIRADESGSLTHCPHCGGILT